MHARRIAAMGQQFAQVFFELLGAPANGRDVGVAAFGAGAWHPLGQAAVVAAQRAVDLVEHAESAAMFALAFPAAVGAMQHRGIAAPVEQQHALLAAFDPFFRINQVIVALDDAASDVSAVAASPRTPPRATGGTGSTEDVGNKTMSARITPREKTLMITIVPIDGDVVARFGGVSW